VILQDLHVLPPAPCIIKFWTTCLPTGKEPENVPVAIAKPTPTSVPHEPELADLWNPNNRSW
jgi:hypothetical protein